MVLSDESAGVTQGEVNTDTCFLLLKFSFLPHRMHMRNGLSGPRTCAPLLSLETSCVHVAEPLRLGFVCNVFLSPICRFRFAQPSHRMSVAYAFSGVSKSLLHEGKTNGRRKRESSGGVSAHDLSDSYPAVSKVMERVVYANSHVAHVEASLSPDGWVGCVAHHIADMTPHMHRTALCC